MFFEVSLNQSYGKINTYPDKINFFTSNKLFQKISAQVVVNNKIKAALENVWKTTHVLEIKPEYLSTYNICKKKNKDLFHLIKSNKKVVSIDFQNQKDSNKHYKQREDEEDNKEKSFKFFIETVLDNFYILHPEIIQISKKAKELLLFCGKKWHNSRIKSFEIFVKILKDYKEDKSKEV